MLRIPQALWHVDSSESVIRQAAIPDDVDLIEIESHYSLISTGTERIVASGKVPTSLYHDMRVPYMEGAFSFPVKYGYSLTGVETQTKRHVHLMHPHQDLCAVQRSDVKYLPDDIPLKRGTLYSNIETVVNAIWDARVLPGESIGVVGFGIIGALVSIVARRIPGCAITVFEVDPDRIEIARSLGFATQPSGHCAVAFHCSATSAGLQSAIESVGIHGRIIELSWYGNQPVNISLGGSFHTMRKQIIGSQVGRIADHVNIEDKYARRHQMVLEILSDDTLDQLITHTISLEEAPALFSRIRSSILPGLGYCIKY